MNAAIQTALSILTEFIGTKNISRAQRPNGIAAFCIMGILLPFLFLLLSELAAIRGSVTASIICPTAFIRPITVSTPRMILPWGIRFGIPDSLDG